MQREGSPSRFVAFPSALWKDGWFLSLSPLAKTLFIYLITCPECNPSGLFRLTLRDIITSTGIPPDYVRVTFFNLEPEVYYFPSRELVWVRNIVRIRKDYRDNPLYWEWALKYVFNPSVPGDIREEWLIYNEPHLRKHGLRVFKREA